MSARIRPRGAGHRGSSPCRTLAGALGVASLWLAGCGAPGSSAAGTGMAVGADSPGPAPAGAARAIAIAVPPAPSPPPGAPAAATLAASPPALNPPNSASAGPASGRVTIGFEDTAVGRAPQAFVDVKTEGPTPDWVYRGNWKVALDDRGQHVLLHDDIRPQPALSFQRFRGTLWGQPDGRVPDAYDVECVMRPLASPDFFPPIGDQGVQFYFLDVENYLEVVIKPSRLEIWEARGAVPGSTQGWSRLWMQPLDTQPGDRRRIGARVDVRAGTFEATLDGRIVGRVTSPLLKPQPAWVALRGTGDTVAFESLAFDVP